MQKISLVARSLDAAAPGCPALKSEIALELKRDQRGEDAKSSASKEARSLWKGERPPGPTSRYKEEKDIPKTREESWE